MKILIAEDDFTSRRILMKMLESYGEIHVAVDGEEAISAYKEKMDAGDPYDLVCLDIMMPKMDGKEVLFAIREIEEEKGVGGKDLVKVVMTTAVTDAKSIMESLIKGSCEAYLSKPLNRQKLDGVMEKLGFRQEYR